MTNQFRDWRLGRRGFLAASASDPFAAYMVNGVAPAIVADFENDFYAGNIEDYSAFTEVGSPSFSTVNGRRCLRLDVGTDEVELSGAAHGLDNPSALSFQMEGFLTYTDTDTEDFTFYWLEANASNYIRARLEPDSAASNGQLNFQMNDTSSVASEIEGALHTFSPGTNIPFNIASRHGHTFMAAAIDGSLQDDVSAQPTEMTPTSIYPLQLGKNISGSGVVLNITRFLVWDEDIGDAGIKQVSSPGAQDVIFVIGQSNSVGWDVHDGGTVHSYNVRQYATADGYDNRMFKGTLPLRHQNFVDGNMGLDISFAEDYVAGQGRDVLFVPAAKGSTGFTANNWNKGDPEYENAVALVNAALANVHGATLKGILWVQGEDDAKSANSMSGAAYAAALDQMISDLRADITGASNVPFVAGQIGTFLSGAAYPTATDINAAIAALPGRVSNTAYASSDSLTDDGGALHYSAAAYRTLGSRMYTALAGLL